MPVREAIRKLEAGNLVTIQNRRIVVNQLSPKNIKDILKVRLMLEGYAASEAAKIGNKEIIPLLKDLLKEMNRTDEVEEYLKANRRFHNTIYRECDNPALMEVIDSLWERYSPYLHILLDNLGDWKQPEFTNAHDELLKAVQKGDPAGARKWVERDLLEAAERVLEMMAGRDDQETKRQKEPDEET
jgi:DNA-binding GntR family transcriptional regulator